MQDIRAGAAPSSANDVQNPPPVLAQLDRGSCPHQQRQRQMTAADPHDQLPRMLHNTTISFWQGEATVAVAGERKGGDSAEYQGGYFGATDGDLE